MKVPGSKFQVPKKSQTPNSRNDHQCGRVWNLEPGTSLELGTWNLEL
jgi:hypothetical protein